jgi:hypothetical protein
MLAVPCLLIFGRGALAVQVLYTFEGDSGTTITDKLTGDGAQDAANVTGGTVVDTTPANAAFGSRSGSFPVSPVQQNTFDVPGSSTLGTAFTLAAMVDETQNDFSRVFSVYDGGPPQPNELIFDIDPSLNAFGFGVRTFVQGTGVVRGVNFADSAYHHVAMTYDNGQVRLFLDGNQLGATAAVPGGNVGLFNDLRFGEDYPPASTTNERLEGHADDVLVYDAALTPQEVKAVARHGASAFFAGDDGIHYSAEGDSSFAADKLIGDGVQDGAFSTAQISIDNAPVNARFGTSSIAFGTSTAQLNRVVIDDSAALTDTFTLSGFVRYDGNLATLNQARFFTSYDGAGSAVPGELLFDFNPDGGSAGINGLRFLINTGSGVQSVIPNVPVTFDDGQYHHLAATYDNGQVLTYVDGVLVATGTAGSGAATLIRNLRLGEDSAGATGPQEQFIGRMDDVLVFRGRTLSKAEMMQLAQQGVSQFLSDPQPVQAGVLYTGAPAAPGDTKDVLLDDGQQQGVFHNNVSLDTNPANARFGPASYSFGPASGSTWNTLELQDTAQLGDAFTLGAFVRTSNSSPTRLFSSYLGTGPIDPGEFLLDFDPSAVGPWIYGLRAVVNGTQVTPPTGTAFNDGLYHHLAMTYDDGLVKLFLDGALLHSGIAGSGPVNLVANLRVAEDLGGTVNEQLIGNVDDILFLRSVLSETEIRDLYRFGAHNVLLPEPGTLALLGFGGLGLLRRRRRR